MFRRHILSSTTSAISSSSLRLFSSRRSISMAPKFNDDFRDGFGGNNNNNSTGSYHDDEESGGMLGFDDDLLSGGNNDSMNRSGMNPADYASSGIHGPAATVARRDSNPDSAGKHRQDFHSEKLGRCILCDEAIGSWMGHVVFVSHQARLAIVERVMTGACGPPDKVVDRWWQLLNVEPEGLMLNRIRSLSSEVNSQKRKERLTYLLRFLQANGVLKVALGVFDSESNSFGRSNVFERFEMVGDNVVKVVFYDRLQSLLPLSDGGAAGKMASIQQLIDSNEGLLQSFDYLELDKIIGTTLSQSKFKSDVMEALFGELQTYLWAVTHHWNSPVEYPAVNAAAGPELQYVEAVVRHTLLELTDCILMFAVESSVVRSENLIKREYKGPKDPKPIPLSKSELERRMMMKRMKRHEQQLESEKIRQARELDLSLVEEGKYSFKPYLTAEIQPIPAEVYMRMSGTDGGMNGNSGISGGGGGGSSSSSFSVGVSVIKPLAQRLAEEEERRRIREASWRLAAPYFSHERLQEQEEEEEEEEETKKVVESVENNDDEQTSRPLSAFEHFHKFMVNAAGEEMGQKEVLNVHLHDFIQKDLRRKTTDEDYFAMSSSSSLLEKAPKKREGKNFDEDFVVCPMFEPLIQEEVAV